MDIDFLRMMAAFFSGVLLSLCGSSIQGSTQNELAGPSTLGLNAFCVLLILLAHFLCLQFSFLPILEWTSLILGLSVLLIAGLFLHKTGIAIKRKGLLLFGLCFNLFIGAIFSFLQYLFMTYNKDFPGQLWFGNFRFVTPIMVLVLFISCVVLWWFFSGLSKKLYATSFGEDVALSCRVDTEKLHLKVFLFSLLGSMFVNSFFGIFAFYGLMVPHILRMIPLFKFRLDLEIKWGSLLSGVFLALLDLFCAHFLLMGTEIPAGMLVSILGSGTLLLLLLRRHQSLGSL